MSYSVPVGASHPEGDSTPVFYSSAKLHVTGMKISAGGSVHPISAITTVEVCGKSPAYLLEMLRGAAAGVGLVIGGAIFGRMLAAFSKSAAVAFTGIAMMGILVVLLTILGMIQFVMEKTLRVRFTSGDALKVAVYDVKVALAMREAVEQALTYGINQSSYTRSVADELEKLSDLRSRGAITSDDWERSKNLFLGKPAGAQELAIVQLRQLFELHTSGVLSESEFNMKKWDILAKTS